MRATWKPHEKHGELTERGDLPGSVFAYPDKRKEPMTDASHVRNAVARFDQVRGVSDAERDLAFANIKKAAKHYGVDLTEAGWHQLGRRPSTGRTAAARKAAATRKRRGTGAATTPARKRAAVRGAATRKKHAAAKKTGAPKKKTAGRRKAGAAKATPARKTAGSRKRAPRKKAVRSKP